MDTAGNPLGAVRISLEDPPGIVAVRPEPRLTAYTKSTGSFSYLADSQSTSILVFSKSGYASVAHRVAETLPQKIVMEPEAIITGTVVSDKGLTVTNAVIGPLHLPDPNKDHAEAGIPPPAFPHRFTHTDSNGYFEIRALKNTTYQFPVRSSGLTSNQVTANPGSTTTVMLSTAGTSISGRLLGSRNQQPLGNAFVEAVTGDLKEYAITDSNGEWIFPMLAPGSWKLASVQESCSLPQPPVDLALSNEPLSDINLLHNQGITVAGEVYDPETSAPISSATLHLESCLSQKTVTDSSGRFRFTKVDGFSDVVIQYDRNVFAYGPGAGMEEYRLSPAGDIKDFTGVRIPLQHRAVIRGRVVTPAGLPAQSAEVLIRAAIPLTVTNTVESAISLMRECDEDGRFSIGVFPPGHYEVISRLPGSATSPQIVQATTTSPVELHLQLLPLQRIGGRVMDSKGIAVPDAKIDAHVTSPDKKRSTWVYGGSVQSEPDGSFELTGLPIQTLEISAEHPEFAVQATAVIEPAIHPPQPVQLRFPAGTDFTAQLRNKDGAPVREAEVFLQFGNGANWTNTSIRSTSEGLVALRSIPDSSLKSIHVSHPEYVAHKITDLKIPQTTRTITLNRKGNVTVALLSESPEDDPDTTFSAFLFRSAISDKGPKYAARYQLDSCQKTAVFSNVEPGTYKAGANTTRGYTESDPFDLREGQDYQLALHMSLAQTTISGKVKDRHSGLPIHGAALRAFVNIPGMPPANTITNSKGEFTMRPGAVSEIRLEVVHPDYPIYRRDHTLTASNRSNLNIQLSAVKVKLKGTATYQDQPVRGTMIVLSQKAQPETPVATTLSKADGSYELADLPPGEYFLTAEAPISKNEKVGHRSVSIDLLEVPDTQTCDIQFARTVLVKGRLASPPSGDANDHRIAFMQAAGGNMHTAAIGSDLRFELELEPGEYKVAVQDEASQSITIPVRSSNEPYHLVVPN